MTKQDRIDKFHDLLCKLYTDTYRQVLVDKLDAMGFFEAPASTRFHGNYPGGLFDHSYEVTVALLKLTDALHLEWGRKDSPYLVGLLHDLCKCDQYIQREDGTFEYAKNLPLNGHGEKSVILAMTFTDLTDEEILCIRWHMGAYDDKENWNNLGAAIEKYPTVLYTHTADMIASRVMGI